VPDKFFRQNPGPSKPWYERDGGQRLKADRKLVAECYPGLEFRIDRSDERVSLEGKIILLAECGIPTEISTRVIFPRLYPLYEPTAFDAENRFRALGGKRRIDRHILESGQCCLWLPPRSPWDPRNPAALLSFLDELAVFFDRQLVYEVTGVWPGAEYGHGENGYVEFIAEKLGEPRETLKRLLPVITMDVCIGRNDLCPCGSNKKFKRCHLNPIERVVAEVGIPAIKRMFSKS